MPFAALLIDLEKRTGKVPHAYFKWHDGNPIVNLFAFLFFGEGGPAPLTHEVLRRALKTRHAVRSFTRAENARVSAGPVRLG